MSTLFAIAMPGTTEMLIIGAIVLLLFGHRLPSMMRSLGKGIVEFKKGVNDIQDDIDEAGNVESKPKAKVESDDKPEE